MGIINGGETMDEERICCADEAGKAAHQRRRPRDEAQLRQLKNRLNRMVGQLNGIGRMLDENRYCGDVLIQIAAVEKALQSFGYIILQDHMKSCVVDEVREGNADIMDEVMELMKKLK